MGDLLSVGYGNAGVSTFPEQWSRLALVDSLNEPLAALVSQNFDGIMPVRSGHIVGLRVRLDNAFDAGTVTITVTINGTPATLQAVLTSADTELAVTQATGIDSFGPNDEVGLQLVTSGDFAWTPTVNLEAWIDTAQAATDGGGGGGTPWLTVEPTPQTTSFTPSPGTLYLLDDPGKFGNIDLPPASSMPANQAIAFKLVFDTNAWSILPDGADTIDGSAATLTFTLVNSTNGNGWFILVSDGSSNWTIVSSNRTLRILNNNTPADPQNRLTGQIDFYSPITVDGSIGSGRTQVYIGGFEVVEQPATGAPILLSTLSGRPGRVHILDTSAPTVANISDTAAAFPGRVLYIKNKHTSTSTLTITPAGGDTIDGLATRTLVGANKAVILIASGGTNWEVISSV